MGYGRVAVVPEAPGMGYDQMMAGRTARGMGYAASLYPLHGAKLCTVMGSAPSVAPHAVAGSALVYLQHCYRLRSPNSPRARRPRPHAGHPTPHLPCQPTRLPAAHVGSCAPSAPPLPVRANRRSSSRPPRRAEKGWHAPMGLDARQPRPANHEVATPGVTTATPVAHAPQLTARRHRSLDDRFRGS